MLRVSARARSLRLCVRTYTIIYDVCMCGAVRWFCAIQRRARNTHATCNTHTCINVQYTRVQDAIAMESSSVAGFLVASYARVVRLGMQRARRTYTEPRAVVERPFEGQGSRLRHRYIYTRHGHCLYYLYRIAVDPAVLCVHLPSSSSSRRDLTRARASERACVRTCLLACLRTCVSAVSFPSFWNRGGCIRGNVLLVEIAFRIWDKSPRICEL